MIKKKSFVLLFFLLTTVLAGDSVKADSSGATLRVRASVPIVCGNSLVETGETCDDGNTQNGDGCSNVCLVEDAVTPPSSGGGSSGGGGSVSLPPTGGTGSSGGGGDTSPDAGSSSEDGVPTTDQGNEDPDTGAGETTDNPDTGGTDTDTASVNNPPAGAGGSSSEDNTSDSETGSSENGGGSSGNGGSLSSDPTTEPSLDDEVGLPSWLDWLFGDADPSDSSSGSEEDNVLPEDLLPTDFSSVENQISTSSSAGVTVRSDRGDFVGRGLEFLAETIGSFGFSSDGGDNDGGVFEMAVGRFGAVVGRLGKIVEEERFEETASYVVAPLATAAASALVVPAVATAAWPFLQYLFFQPFLIFGRARRRSYGLVYNALNKMPVDLAIVRLLDFETGRVVQTRVTDQSGAYVFTPRPGHYRVEVRRDGFDFPSILLKNFKVDGDFVDIYHGEELVVDLSDATVSPNIPVDPREHDLNAPPARLRWQKIRRLFQEVIALIGLILVLGAFVFDPSFFTAGLSIFHILLYSLFRRFAKPPKAKGWGVVYDAKTRQPITEAVVRLYAKKEDKLVGTAVTGRRGQYNFLAGPNEYRLTFERTGYEKLSKEIKLSGKQSGVVKENVALSAQKEN